MNIYKLTILTAYFFSFPLLLFGQHTITVKKESKLNGLYIGKSYGDTKSLFKIGGTRVFTGKRKLQYVYFSKNGVATIGFFNNKSKKHNINLKECAENGKYCEGLKIYNYRVNEDFADKGISPYRHIEFYEVVNTFSRTQEPTLYNNFKFSKVEAELEGPTLHLKYRDKESAWNNYYILIRQ